MQCWLSCDETLDSVNKTQYSILAIFDALVPSYMEDWKGVKLVKISVTSAPRIDQRDIAAIITTDYQHVILTTH